MKLLLTKKLFFSVLFFFAVSSFADDLLYQVENFSAHARKRIADDGQNAIYNVFINRVSEFLPTEYGIKHRIIKPVDMGVFPAKPILKLIRHMVVTFDPTVRIKKPRDFFGNLNEGKPHTFTITPYYLIFTESTSTPMEEQCKDKISKHYFISTFAHKVRFAGQFYVYKNPDNDDVVVVFDNSSGTYQPDENELPNLEDLLDANFADEGLKFITKSFDETIDRDEVFKDKKPIKAQAIKSPGHRDHARSTGQADPLISSGQG